MLKKFFLVSAVALCINTGALANGTEPTPIPEVLVPISEYAPGIYLGIQLGYDLSGWKNLNNLQKSSEYGFNSKLTTEHENGLAGRIFLGYDINKNFAIEAGWLHLNNEAKINEHFTGGIIYDTKLAEISTNAVDLSGKMKLPLNDTFDLYGKLGLAYLMSHGLQKADQAVNDTQDWLFSKNSFNRFSAAYGFGINYNITPNVIADLSWTQIYGYPSLKMNESSQFTVYQPNVNFFGIGLAYKFDV